MAEAADDGAEVGATVAASAGGGGRLGTGDPPGPGPPQTAGTTRARRRGVRSTGRMRGGVRRRRPRAAGWEGNRELTAIRESSGRRRRARLWIGKVRVSERDQRRCPAAAWPPCFTLRLSLLLGNTRTGRPPGRQERGEVGSDRTPVLARSTSCDHPTVRTTVYRPLEDSLPLAISHTYNSRKLSDQKQQKFYLRSKIGFTEDNSCVI